MTATPHSETSAGGEPVVSRHRRVVGIAAVVLLAVAAAFAAWLAFGREDDNASPTQTGATTLPATLPAAANPASVASPSIVSLGRLRAAAAASTVPIYWVGSRTATKLELTNVAGNTVFLRYLPPKASAGAASRSLTIATYERRNAFAEVERAAKNGKSKTIPLAGGGIAVYDPARTTNVHLAYPGQTYQIEVYAPEPGLALRLVESGAVRPVT